MISKGGSDWTMHEVTLTENGERYTKDRKGRKVLLLSVEQQKQHDREYRERLIKSGVLRIVEGKELEPFQRLLDELFVEESLPPNIQRTG